MHYQDYAKYLIDFLDYYHKILGVNIDVLSLQNEPNVTAPWDSCIWTGAELRDFLKILKQFYTWLIRKEYSCIKQADIDDIDHLSNRRVRTVGEQLYTQFGVGLARMARTIRERMNVRDNEVFTPVDLINSKTLSSVINSFFGTNQL
jgi:DNA-directed RNA polymerase beta subunit